SQGKEGKVIVNDKVDKKYPLLYSISLENYFNQSLIEGSKAKELLYNHGNHNNLNIKYSLLSSGRLEQNNHNFINYGMKYSIIV
ncbi:hypothetical protein RYX45_23055, partial [Alkalihalophilus pseudofirmus]